MNSSFDESILQAFELLTHPKTKTALLVVDSELEVRLATPNAVKLLGIQAAPEVPLKITELADEFLCMGDNLISLLREQTSSSLEYVQKDNSTYLNYHFLPFTHLNRPYLLIHVTDASETAHLVQELNQSRNELRLIKSHLTTIAYTDSLTGLKNRRSFESDLEFYTNRASGLKTDMAIMLIDIDNLKWVNDTRGHTRGDEMLGNFARVLLNTLRKGDDAYRIGGDEFVIFLHHIEARDIETIARRLNQAVRRQMLEEGFPELSYSTGVALLSETNYQSTDAFRLADQRMYAEKSIKSPRHRAGKTT